MRGTRLGAAVSGSSALALVAAFVLLPRPVATVLSGRGYGGEQRLVDRVSSAFVDYWRAGRGPLTPDLLQVVDYWRWYHLVKATTAMGLLVLLIVIAARLRTRFAPTAGVGTGRRPSVAGAVVATGLSPFAFVLVLANVQGAVAPFSSVLSLLPVPTARGDLALSVGQVQQQAARYPEGSSAALRMIVGDLRVYHVVVAGISSLVAVALVGLVVTWWRSGARAAARSEGSRGLLGTLTAGALVVAASLAVLGFANLTTALDSPAAVVDFYRGTS